MKVGVYFCNCGSNISEVVDFAKVREEVARLSPESYAVAVDFLCSAEGKEYLTDDLRKNRPERVVVAACSPREYESTFMQILGQAGINPYFLQMVNIREQVSWVTPDPAKATEKACTWIRSAMARVCLHEPLEKKEVDASPDALVIGAGPAGLQSALFLAQSGRKVILVEKSAAIGGLPVRYEELFPAMECGPCLLEPVEAEVLHGDHAHNIELLLLSEVEQVTGYYGNFTVKIRQTPRFVDAKCIGCGMCVEACPASTKNDFNCRLDDKKAIAIPFPGALPNLPYIDPKACLRRQGEDCRLCEQACPIPGTIALDQREQLLERKVGAIIVAIGSRLYDCRKVTSLGYGEMEDVYTSLEFERIAAANGPTAGQIRTRSGKTPESIAIIHCVGSLDPNHQPHCSGVCCSYALKFNRIVAHKLPGVKVHHFYKELAVAGKDGFGLLRHARENPNASFIRYDDISQVSISQTETGQIIAYLDADGKSGAITSDMVVLCPAVMGAEDSPKLAAMTELTRNSSSFFAELNGRLHAAQSKVKGIYLAGSCQAPMDIREATGQGMAAAGYVLSGLVEGKKLVVEPITASVDEERCSGCRLCGSICPYKAISFVPETQTSEINALLCHGCGTCVAACPAGAIKGNHFTNDQISAEIEALLQ